MEHLGFIQDMMDVKVLILFVAARLKGAATVQELYELAYQDERLSYFDVCTAVPEMVQSGHLQQLPGARYRITEKGRADGAVTERWSSLTGSRSAAVSSRRRLSAGKGITL